MAAARAEVAICEGAEMLPLRHDTPFSRIVAGALKEGGVENAFAPYLNDGPIARPPGVDWAPRGNVTLTLDSVLLLGPDHSEYRLAPVRGALQARVKVLF